MSMSVLEVPTATVSSESPSRPSQNGREDSDDDCENADYNVYLVVR